MPLKNILDDVKSSLIVISEIDAYYRSLPLFSKSHNDGWIHASQIGKCARRIQYGLLNVEVPNVKIPTTTRAVFDHGHEFHNRIQNILMKRGILMPCDCEKALSIPELKIRGKCDGIITLNSGLRALLEIKSAREDFYRKYKKYGPDVGYIRQVHTYMWMGDLEATIFYIANKNTHEHFEVRVDRQDHIINLIRTKCTKIWGFLYDNKFCPKECLVRKDADKGMVKCPYGDICFSKAEKPSHVDNRRQLEFNEAINVTKKGQYLLDLDEEVVNPTPRLGKLKEKVKVDKQLDLLSRWE